VWQWLVPFVEIGIITVMIYYLLSFFWNTRAKDMTLGILVLASLYGFSMIFDLPVLQNLMRYFVNAAVIGVMIIFQPELRQALSRLIVKAKKFREGEEFDKFLDDLTHSVYHLSERRIGALIVLENQNSLDEYAKKAVSLNAEFTPELIESIFSATTPLHDGGVIIRSSTILSAATIFPLAEESSQITKSMGTRHRAGLGISQVTDAIVIVVSEETGNVNIARDGIMTRGVKPDRFKGIIRSVFTRPEGLPSQTFFEKIKNQLFSSP
jgi:uncharacterized protein (TIGR00159 family)